MDQEVEVQLRDGLLLGSNSGQVVLTHVPLLRPKSITPVSPQQLRNKSTATSPQRKQQVCNKLARAKVLCVCCVVLFPKFHYNNNNLLPTSWQLPRLRVSYGETSVMDFVHYQAV